MNSLKIFALLIYIALFNSCRKENVEPQINL